MRAKINLSPLEKMLKKIEGVADKKATMAVLSMVLVENDPSENLLYFTATDLELGYKGKLRAQIELEGEPFCVPARKFYEIVKAFPEDELIVEKNENRLVIKDENERILYNLAIISSEEFPSLPEFVEENALEIPAKVLEELIDKTIFCTSKDESRFVLGGIYFEPLKEEGKLRAVASDGHRLVKLDREVIGIDQVNFDEGFILGRKAANQILEILEDELVVKLGYINNYVVLWSSNSLFFARTLEGSYPNYRSVIPESFNRILKVDRKLFLEAIKRASILITEKFKPITLELQPDEIIISSPDTEVGKAQIKLSAQLEGDPISISYNAEYLLDALQNMQSEEIEMKVGEERTPTLITGYRDEDFLYLLMPMVL
ncbi:MAG: DNA polymerase III subunit beta [Thermodesulfobacteriaceae bacterium]|nr:DNA polymerase III subunit beta [Thermodesulfobacteriaceae bacterium]MDW8136549.1 DNA polymerase III subunit beta [Thermodesulfobacterium sp.]